MEAMNDEKYKTIHSSNTGILKNLIDKQLNEIKVHIVDPEYNIVFMKLDSNWYGVNGVIGSEIIEIKRYLKTKHVVNSQFEPYELFVGHRISNCRVLGDVWNGYGIEINFQGIYDKSIIIQSIYTGDKPNGFDDCIRLGIGNYYYNTQKE